MLYLVDLLEYIVLVIKFEHWTCLVLLFFFFAKESTLSLLLSTLNRYNTQSLGVGHRDFKNVK